MKTTLLDLTKSRIATLTLLLITCSPSMAAGRGFIIGIPLGSTPGTAPVAAIDPATGVYSILSVSGNSYNALAQDSNRNLYAGSFSTTQENGRVSRIDRTSGVALEIFDAVTPGAGSIRGLSFDDANMLFAAVNRNDAQGSPTLHDDLYEIDLLHETTTRIGSLGFLGVQGLDFSPGGSLYAWDVNEGLLIVDPITGAAVDVNSSVGGTAAIQSIVFAPDGRLFGARQQLFSIDPNTGAFAPIGPGSGLDVRGIEWIVPEPSTMMQIVAGLLLVSFSRTGSICGTGRAGASKLERSGPLI
jgi:hypothetical protein